MVFGEIVEPTTRALIDDEIESYPDYIPPHLLWEGNLTAPKDIDVLIFVESQRIVNVFLKILLNQTKPIAVSKNAGVEMYNVENKFLVLFKETKEFTTCQLVEEMADWIKKSKHVYAITSNSISNYVNDNLSSKPVSLIKSLSTDVSHSFGYDKLESPNLITGLGAAVLSYAIHNKLHCALFVLYLDASPLDSLNCSPLVELLTKMNIDVKLSEFKATEPSSGNLYM